MSTDDIRRCRVRRCESQISPAPPLCRKHWWQASADLRARYWRAETDEEREITLAAIVAAIEAEEQSRWSPTS